MTNSVDENANARATAVALHRLNTSQIGNDVIQVFRASDLFRLSSKQTLYGISDTKLHVFTVSVVFYLRARSYILMKARLVATTRYFPQTSM